MICSSFWGGGGFLHSAQKDKHNSTHHVCTTQLPVLHFLSRVNCRRYGAQASYFKLHKTQQRHLLSFLTHTRTHTYTHTYTHIFKCTHIRVHAGTNTDMCTHAHSCIKTDALSTHLSVQAASTGTRQRAYTGLGARAPSRDTCLSGLGHQACHTTAVMCVTCAVMCVTTAVMCVTCAVMCVTGAVMCATTAVMCVTGAVMCVTGAVMCVTGAVMCVTGALYE